MEKLKNTVFYALDKAIKTYRQFAQKNINKLADDITIDQWLVLKSLHESPDISQTELAQNVFKDYSSITRIIDRLVKKKYLDRKAHPKDRRRFRLELTPYAKSQLNPLFTIIQSNRKQALEGLTQEEIKLLHKTLEKIVLNCQTK